MKIVITGADGFIGRNVRAALAERSDVELVPITRTSGADSLNAAVKTADAVFHLAGVNRPQDPAEFEEGNANFTARLCDALLGAEKPARVIFTSSTQVERDNPYGQSKRAAEEHLFTCGRESSAIIRIYRLPNVFGKWSRPNYNSAVATFCYNVTHGLPISIHDRASEVRLVYIDDVVSEFLRAIEQPELPSGFGEVEPVYLTRVGELADQIMAFREVRNTLLTERVGVGLKRALYATYVSFLDPEHFAYSVPRFDDPRGSFVEILKTLDSGQLSFFTAHPGVTRGGHYHHSKTEKFLVVKGQARFRFRHILTSETFELSTDAAIPMIVDTIPGWAHDITNVGDDEMIVVLWANEVFDRSRPDTFAQAV
jgi:UDP-2-acetamido-2,6-beta-L-arabino-hexul-4-ose reductase